MVDLKTLQLKLSNLKTKKIQLSTRIEELIRQEQEQKAKLLSLGISDVDGSLKSLNVESQTLQTTIDMAFRGFNGAN